MSATKILWGQLLFVSVVVLAFLWAATEWTAWRLAFQPQLGPAWFVIGRWPVYQPLAFFIWWFKFDAYAPKIFIEGGGIAASGGIAAMGVAIIALGLARERSPARHDVWLGALGRYKGGSARGTSWAGRRRAWPSWWQLSPARRSRTCAVFCADAVREGRRSRHPNPPDMAVFHDRPRHQGREFPVDLRLACAVWVRAPVRSDQSRERGL